MRLQRLSAKNFKIFEQFELDFEGKSTVIFGVNGTGKSSVLSAVNYLFYDWLEGFNLHQAREYRALNDDAVQIGKNECRLEADILFCNQKYELSCYHKRTSNLYVSENLQNTYNEGQYSKFKSEFADYVNHHADAELPLFVCYGTNRFVKEISLNIREDNFSSQIYALENAMAAELDFKSFFEWFRNQEDLENEVIRETGNSDYQDILLRCVRTAIETMLGDVSEIKVKRKPLCMKVKKGEQEILVNQLSDGEKCTLALFGDLARRIAIANQNQENPLKGKGIVLIDEIELHMHPSWQRRVLGVLKEVFPNIQFIVTTHSPQVLGEADSDYNIVLLENEEHKSVTKRIGRMDGFDSNYILEVFMGTPSKNEKTKELIHLINVEIMEKHYSEAEQLLEQLKSIAGDNDAEVILAEGFLKKSRWLDEKN